MQRSKAPSANWTQGRPDADLGTQDWADHVRSTLVHRVTSLGNDEHHFAFALDVLTENDGWKLLTKPDGSFFGSLEEFIRFRRPYGLGVSMGELAPFFAAAEAKNANRSTVPLAKLRRDGGTQSRAQLDDATVAEYAERLAELPPVTVYHDGEAYWLADGFHRVAAHELAGATEVLCDVRQGSRRDAVLHSVGANAAHGLRRSKADKRRAARTLLEDDEWKGWSDELIAEKCGVSQQFVSKLSNELTISVGLARPEMRLGKDGKFRRRPSKPKPSEPHQGQRAGPTRQEPRSVVGEDGVRRMPEEHVCEHCGSAVSAGQRFCNNDECWRQSTEPTRVADHAPDTEPDPRQVDMFEAAPASEAAGPHQPRKSPRVLLVMDSLEALTADERRAVHTLARERGWW